MRDTAVAIATTSTTALATTFILIACVVILVVISILLATSYYAYCTHVMYSKLSNEEKLKRKFRLFYIIFTFFFLRFLIDFFSG